MLMELYVSGIHMDTHTVFFPKHGSIRRKYCIMEKSSYVSFNKRKFKEAPLRAWELDVPTCTYMCVHRNPQPAFGIYSLRQSKDLYVVLVFYQPWRVQRQPCVLLMDKIWTAANPKVNPMHLKHFIRQLSFLSFFLSLSLFFFELRISLQLPLNRSQQKRAMAGLTNVQIDSMSSPPKCKQPCVS